MAVTDERGVAVCSARRRGGVLFPALRRGPLTKACNLSLCSSVILVIASCKEDGNLAILRTMERWSRALNHTPPPRQERCLQGEHSGPLSCASLTEGRTGGRGGGAGRGGKIGGCRGLASAAQPSVASRRRLLVGSSCRPLRNVSLASGPVRPAARDVRSL